MKSQQISQADLASLQQSGQTLEQDERGVKVTLLPDGRILKLFRLRRLLSSGLIYSNARHFCRNVQRLHQLGIATMRDCQLFYVAGSSDRAVIYQPIAGETLRKLLKQAKVTDAMLARLGEFIAELHSKGIYFRSLHLGNVVYLADGSMGLIDVADMRIYPWALHFFTRLRNFNRIKKYDEDMQFLNTAQRQLLMQSYIAKAGYQGRQKAILSRYLSEAANA